MIADLGLPSIELNRQHSKRMMMHRITYGLVDIPANLHLKQSTTYTRGHGLEDMDGAVVRYWIPYAGHTSTATHSSFFGARMWNQLPKNMTVLQTQSHSGNNWLATPLNTDIILTVYTIFTFICALTITL